jgi:hypothetical protein
MRSIERALRRIVQDIVAGRNLDAYVVSLIGIALIALDVLGDVETSLQLTVLIAAVALLLFRATAPEQSRVDLDAVLQDRQGYSPFRDFIRGGRTLWVYGPSAYNILREASDIKREILDHGGEVRVLVQDPRETPSMNILRRQLDRTHNLDHDIDGSLFTLRQMREWGNVDFRLLPYSPGFSLVIVDPNRKDGRLTVEFFGFRNELISERMHIEISRQTSQYWFEYWARQFEVMWETGSPESR